MHNRLFHRLLKYVHVGRGELSGADLLLEEHVELGKCAASGLRQTEEDVNDAKETGSSLLPISNLSLQ